MGLVGPLAEARLHSREHQGQSEITWRSIRPCIPIYHALELFGAAQGGKLSLPFPHLVLSHGCGSKGHLLFGAGHPVALFSGLAVSSKLSSSHIPAWDPRAGC